MITSDTVLFEPKQRRSQMAPAIGIFLFMIALGLLFIYLAITSPFNDIGTAVFYLIFMGSSTGVLVLARLKAVKFKIYNDCIEVYNRGRLKETVMLRDIDSWDEVEMSSKKGKIKTLYLFSGDKPYGLGSERIYDNYEELKKLVTRGKKRNDTDWQDAMQQKRRPAYIAGIALGLILLVAGIASMQYKQPEMSQQEVVTLYAPLGHAVNKNLGKYCKG